jgi:alanyl-tRNA synthetase
VAAQAAEAAARGLAARAVEVARLSGPALAEEVKALGVEMESLTLPMVAKATLRATLAELQEKVKAEGKAAAGARAAEVAQLARSMAASTEWEMLPYIVSTVEAGSDKDAINAAINTAREVRPKHAVLLVSPDSEAGKLTIVAAVPDALVKRGFKAGDWVKVAAEACGGRGGGKPDMAQGGGTDLARLKDALNAARSFAAAKVTS